MKDFLKVNYGIQVHHKVKYQSFEGYQDDHHLYFIIPTKNKETIYMEQAALSYFLLENGYHQVATPVPSLAGKWFHMMENIPMMVVKIDEVKKQHQASHGTDLANFHQIGTAYQYEPEQISSYGKWKDLWINKLTAFEHKINEEASKHKNNYYRLVMDMLPYLIGISENAIQYMQESESERRYHIYDQGTVTFRRYHENVQKPIIWFQDFVYDHPMRDLSEYIRHQLLSDDDQGLEISKQFVAEYESVRLLSIFSWRLLYARLIFPTHIYDCLEDAFLYQDFNQSYHQLNQILHKQEKYEKRLASLFEVLDVDYKKFQIPMLYWL